MSKNAALVLAAAFAFGWGSPTRPLYDMDESRYAEIAREMRESGDWIVPRLDGVPYLDKPPLLMWSAAAGIAVFGPGEIGPRLVSFLFGVAMAAALWLAGRAAWGGAAGRWAAAIWCTSALPLAEARIVSTDMLLCALAVGSALAFWRALEDGRMRWALAGWALAGAAFLTKGPVGFVIPALGGAAYAIAHRGIAWRRLRPAIGVPLCIAIAAPWYVAIQARHPEFARWFFLVQNFGGFATREVHHAGSAALPLVVTLGGLLPWTPALVAMGIADRAAWADAKMRFLAIWAALLLGFFTISVAKLIPYQLPMMPSLALVGGVLMVRAADRRAAIGHAVMALVGAVGVAWLAVRHPVLSGWQQMPVPSEALIAAAVLAVGAAAAAALAWKGRHGAAGVALAAGVVLAIVPADRAVRLACDERRSTRNIVRENAGAIGNLPVVVLGRPNYSTIYYVRRPVWYAGSPYELEFGIPLGSFDPRVSGQPLPDMAGRQRTAMIVNLRPEGLYDVPAGVIEVDRRGAYALWVSKP